MRRKRRTSQWGRGIIKKKKPIYFKKDEDDDKGGDSDNPEAEEDSIVLENGELEVSTDCHEENGEEAAELSVNDESSCDVDTQTEKLCINNSILEKENCYAPGEEECSNESLSVDSSVLLKTGITSRKQLPPKGAYINGDSSADSLEGLPLSVLCNGKAKGVKVVHLSGNKQKSSDVDKTTEEPEIYKLHLCSVAHDSGNVKRTHPEVTQLGNIGNTLRDPVVDNSEADKEGASKMKKIRKVILDQVPEESSDQNPPLLVDHCRLKNLLDVLVKKSSNLAVDELERWYSVLSQCIYQHREDYDKTQLIEAMERTVEMFETFL